jgi:hypothetical protein
MASDASYFENVGPEAVPDGQYDGRLVRVEEVETKNYGLRLKWTFNVDDPNDPLGAPEVTKFTSLSANESSKAGEIIVALTGRSLARGERLLREKLYGLPCRLIVGHNDGGWNVVHAVMRPLVRATTAAAVPKAASAALVSTVRATQADPDELPPTPDVAPVGDELTEA